MSYCILGEFTANELRKAELERLMYSGMLKICSISNVQSGIGERSEQK